MISNPNPLKRAPSVVFHFYLAMLDYSKKQIDLKYKSPPVNSVPWYNDRVHQVDPSTMQLCSTSISWFTSDMPYSPPLAQWSERKLDTNKITLGTQSGYPCDSHAPRQRWGVRLFIFLFSFFDKLLE